MLDYIKYVGGATSHDGWKVKDSAITVTFLGEYGCFQAKWDKSTVLPSLFGKIAFLM